MYIVIDSLADQRGTLIKEGLVHSGKIVESVNVNQRYDTNKLSVSVHFNKALQRESHQVYYHKFRP